MAGVRKLQRRPLGIEALRALALDPDLVPGLHRPRDPIAPEYDRRRLGAQELAHQSAQRRDRPACASAGDPGDRFALSFGGALVDDQTDRPVPFRHFFWGERDDDKPKAVQRHFAETPALDLEGHYESARALCGLDLHLAWHARTHIIAAAVLVVLSIDLPLWCSHIDTSSAIATGKLYVPLCLIETG